MKETVKLCYIGVGRRGRGMLESRFCPMEDVEITVLCDTNPAALESAAEMLESLGRPRPRLTDDYRTAVTDPEVDAVVVMTGWGSHVSCALAAMEAGKYTAIEVGCADSLDECWQLVDTCERTGAPLMMLENCCYGRRELMALRMVRQGLFGEVVYCAGGYHHYLNDVELFLPRPDGGIDTNHYRLAEYARHNAEQYPTHELGPISKLLGLNRGNRALTLSTFSSKSRGLSQYMQDHVPADHPLAGAEFRQGDIVSTHITCAGGELIHLTLDTTVPRPYYNREFTVRGTRGACIEHGAGKGTFYLEGMPEDTFDNEAEFYAKYDHPLYDESVALDSAEGHGGIDWRVVRAFIESVKRGVPTPIDVYDTALWMSVGPLSEESIRRGGAPVEIPDFTRGKWQHREPVTPGRYCLDVVCDADGRPL